MSAEQPQKPQTWITARPWGKFEQFTHNHPSTVKLITLYPGERTSLQYHYHRDEFWRILDGPIQVTLGEETRPAEAGEELWVPRKTKHRLGGFKTTGRVLEISFGDFDEEDIVRLEDRYGRTVEAE